MHHCIAHWIIVEVGGAFTWLLVPTLSLEHSATIMCHSCVTHRRQLCCYNSGFSLHAAPISNQSLGLILCCFPCLICSLRVSRLLHRCRHLDLVLLCLRRLSFLSLMIEYTFDDIFMIDDWIFIYIALCLSACVF